MKIRVLPVDLMADEPYSNMVHFWQKLVGPHCWSARYREQNVLVAREFRQLYSLSPQHYHYTLPITLYLKSILILSCSLCIKSSSWFLRFNIFKQILNVGNTFYQIIRIVQSITSFIIKILIHRLHVSAHWSHHQAFIRAQIQIFYYWDPKSLQYWSISNEPKHVACI